MSDETFKFTPGKPNPEYTALDGQEPSMLVAGPEGVVAEVFTHPPPAPPRELLEGPATLPAGVSYYFPPNFSGLTCHRFIASRFSKAIGRMSFNNQRFVFHFE